VSKPASRLHPHGWSVQYRENAGAPWKEWGSYSYLSMAESVKVREARHSFWEWRVEGPESLQALAAQAEEAGWSRAHVRKAYRGENPKAALEALASGPLERCSSCRKLHPASELSMPEEECRDCWEGSEDPGASLGDVVGGIFASDC